MSITRNFPQGLPKAIGPYSPSTSASLESQHKKINKDTQDQSLVYISGQIPINPQTNEIDKNDIEGQAHQVMKNLGKALEGSCSSFNLVLKTTILLTDMRNFEKVNKVYGSYFEKDKYPARICYAVVSLPKNSLIEIDAIAVKGQEQLGQPRKRVKLSKQ